MNKENLISLANRPLEDRKRIARLGGLARQEQRRKQFKVRSLLYSLMDAEPLIKTYCKNPRSSNYKIKNKKQLYNSSLDYSIKLKQDVLEVIKELDAEEELRKKQLRKERNRRYYIKHRKKS